MQVGKSILLLSLLFHAFQQFLILRSHRALEKEKEHVCILPIRNALKKQITFYESLESIGQSDLWSQLVDRKKCMLCD
jgi:hypothetical protein